MINHADQSRVQPLVLLCPPTQLCDCFPSESSCPPLGHFLEQFARPGALLARRCGERLGIIAHRHHRLAPGHLHTGNYEITNNLWPLISTQLGLSPSTEIRLLKPKV